MENGGARNPNPLDTNTTMSPYNVGGVRASTAATAEQTAAFTGGDLEPTLFKLDVGAAIAQITAKVPIREIELLRFDGQPYFLCWAEPHASWLVAANEQGTVRTHFAQSALLAKAQQAVPTGQLTEAIMLTDYDAYYLSIGSVAPRRLPMLRVKFDDSAQTWLYIDPHTGSIARRYDTYGRGWRYVMNGLHTWDFLRYRPLWDIFMLVMCAGGLLLSSSAIVLSLRRFGWLKTTKPIQQPKVKQPHVTEEITA